MYFFIFGFQRLVWCPKWTPASNNSFMPMVDIRAPWSLVVASARVIAPSNRAVPGTSTPLGGRACFGIAGLGASRPRVPRRQSYHRRHGFARRILVPHDFGIA